MNGLISAETNNMLIQRGTTHSGELHIKPFLIAFQLMAEASFIIASNGRVTGVNKAFELMLGYQADELIEHDIYRWLPEVRNEQFFTSLRESHCWSGEVWLMDQSELFCPLWLRFMPINDENGHICSYIGMLTKVRSSLSTKQYVRNPTLFDPVTELINHHVFVDRCNRLVEQCHSAGEQAAVILFNLDMFEDINIALGHEAGDKVLAIVAERLKSYLPKQSLLAHMGGDEFSVFTVHSALDYRLNPVLDAMIEKVSQPHQFEGREIYISISVGISVFPSDGSNANDLIDHARLALLEAKRIRRGSWCFYQHHLTQRGKERIELEAPLRHAIEDNRGLKLFYQPQVDLSTGKVTGVEALIRWQNGSVGAVSPERLIAVAECSNLIESLGDWVMEKACWQMSRWRLADVPIGKVAINLSIRQFRSGSLVDKIANLLDKYNLPPWLLELEVTETAIEPDHGLVCSILERIRGLGCSVAIDDFGTGYSTLYYLQHFPADVLKIDKSFVSGLPENQANTALVKTVITLAHNFGLKALAEGIENLQQHDFLASLGCDEGQGFKYTQALPAEQFVEWLETFQMKAPNLTQ